MAPTYMEYFTHHTPNIFINKIGTNTEHFTHHNKFIHRLKIRIFCKPQKKYSKPCIPTQAQATTVPVKKKLPIFPAYYRLTRPLLLHYTWSNVIDYYALKQNGLLKRTYGLLQDTVRYHKDNAGVEPVSFNLKPIKFET